MLLSVSVPSPYTSCEKKAKLIRQVDCLILKSISSTSEFQIFFDKELN